LQKTVRLLQFF